MTITRSRVPKHWRCIVAMLSRWMQSKRGQLHQRVSRAEDLPRRSVLVLVIVIIVIDVPRTTSRRRWRVKEGTRGVGCWSASGGCWCIEGCKSVVFEGFFVCIFQEVGRWCRCILSGSRGWGCKVRCVCFIAKRCWRRCRYCWSRSVVGACTRCGCRSSIPRSVPCWST